MAGALAVDLTADLTWMRADMMRGAEEAVCPRSLNYTHQCASNLELRCAGAPARSSASAPKLAWPLCSLGSFSISFNARTFLTAARRVWAYRCCRRRRCRRRQRAVHVWRSPALLFCSTACRILYASQVLGCSCERHVRWWLTSASARCRAEVRAARETSPHCPQTPPAHVHLPCILLPATLPPCHFCRPGLPQLRASAQQRVRQNGRAPPFRTPARRLGMRTASPQPSRQAVFWFAEAIYGLLLFTLTLWKHKWALCMPDVPCPPLPFPFFPSLKRSPGSLAGGDLVTLQQLAATLEDAVVRRSGGTVASKERAFWLDSNLLCIQPQLVQLPFHCCRTAVHVCLPTTLFPTPALQDGWVPSQL